MSLSNLYSGFKSLGETLLSPTKVLFQGKEEPRRSINYEKKGSISTAASPHAYSKTEYSPERDLWDEAVETSLFTKPKGHKSRQEAYSTSTQASYVNPWKKPGHSHRKSLLNLVGEQGIDSIKLHDGEIEAVQSTEAPFLFAKGGYESHVTTQNVKPQHMPKKSISRKGGFLIMEKEGEAEEEEFDPLSRPTIITKNNNRQSFHGSQTCRANTPNDSFSSYAQKVEISLKNKAAGIPKISAKDPQGNEINDPLTGSTVNSSIGKQRHSFKRINSVATPHHLSDNLLTDSLLFDTKASSAKDKQPLSPGLVDNNSFHSTHVRRATGSYLNITPSHSSHSRTGSTVIFEDQSKVTLCDLS